MGGVWKDSVAYAPDLLVDSRVTYNSSGFYTLRGTGGYNMTGQIPEMLRLVASGSTAPVTYSEMIPTCTIPKQAATFEFWVRPNSSCVACGLLLTSTSSSGFKLSVTSGMWVYEEWNTAGVATFEVGLSQNAAGYFSHIVVAVAINDVKLFVNGKQMGSFY